MYIINLIIYKYCNIWYSEIGNNNTYRLHKSISSFAHVVLFLLFNYSASINIIVSILKHIIKMITYNKMFPDVVTSS